jgi:Mg-chelatase subunit ChlD
LEKRDKKDWMNHYYPGGGTNLANAFNQTIHELASDYTVEGKKIIVCFTDGDVSDCQISDVKRDIMRYGSDIKAMIIGVGSKMKGGLAQEIVGEDNLILTSQDSEAVLMETIMRLLDG